MAGGGASRKTSWRSKPPSQRAKSSATRWIGRLLSTLLAIALLAAVVAVILWLPSRSGTSKLLAIYPHPDDSPKMTALAPFAKQNCEEFQENQKLKDNKKYLTGAAVSWTTDPEALLARKIGEMQGKTENDVFIVYITGLGFSNGKQAYILCGDDETPHDADGVPGRSLDVGKLLKQLKQITFKGPRLLLLDLGSHDVNPRQGLLVDDFPILLEKEVKASAAANVWVVNATAMFQVNRVLYSQKRSLFGQAVAAALTGPDDMKSGNSKLANQSGSERKISLFDFYNYVLERCASQSAAEDGTPGQTPVLLRGGLGMVVPSEKVWGKDAKNLIVVRVAAAVEPKAVESKEKQAAPAGPEKMQPDAPEKVSALAPRGLLSGMASTVGLTQVGGPPLMAQANASSDAEGAKRLSAKAADSSTEKTGKSSAQQSGDPAGEGKSPNAQPGESPGAAVDKFASDKTASDKTAPDKLAPGQLGPGELAPDKSAGAPVALPTNMEDLFLAWKLRDEIQNGNLGQHWSPIDFGPHHWQSLIASLLAHERRVLAGIDVPDDLTEIVGTLNELKAAMQAGRTISKESELDQAVVRAWDRFLNERLASRQSSTNALIASIQKDYARLFWDTTCVVDWYEHASLTDSTRSPERLSQFLDELARFGDALVDSAKRRGDHTITEIEYKPINENFARLKARGELIKKTIFDADMKAISAMTAESAAGDRRAQAELLAADLLRTPLLDAAQRRKLYVLLKPSQTPPATASLSSPKKLEISQEGTKDEWQRLQDRTELQVGVIALATGAPSESLTIPNLDRSNTAERLQAYRAVGREIRTLMADLPADLLAGKYDRFQAWRLSQLVDPTLQDQDPIRDFQASLEWDVRVRQRLGKIRLGSGTGVFAVFEKDFARLVVSAEDWPESLRQIEITLAFNPQQLEVRTEDDQPIKPDVPIAIPLVEHAGDHRGAGLRILNVRASAAQPASLSVALVAHDELVPPGAPTLLACDLQGARPIELAIRRHGLRGPSVRPQLDSEGGRAPIKTIPGRSTAFDIMLANKTQEEVSIEARLLAVPSFEVAARALPGGRAAEKRPAGPATAADLKRVLHDPAGKLKQDLIIADSVTADGKPQVPLPPGGNVALAFKRHEVPAPPANPAAKEPLKAPAEPADPSLFSMPRNWDGRTLACVISSTANPDKEWIYVLELEMLAPREFLEPDVKYDLATRKISVDLALSPNFLATATNFEVDLAKSPLSVELKPNGEAREGVFSAILNGQPCHLEWNAPAEGEDPQFEIDILGYPRAFRFRVSRATGDVEEIPRKSGARIRTIHSIPDSKLSYVNDPFALSRAAKPDAPPAGPEGAAQPDERFLRAGDWAAFPEKANELRLVLAVDLPAAEGAASNSKNVADAVDVRLKNLQGNTVAFGELVPGGGPAYLPRTAENGSLAIAAAVREHDYSVKVAGSIAIPQFLFTRLRDPDEQFSETDDEPSNDDVKVAVVIAPKPVEIDFAILDKSKAPVRTLGTGGDVSLSVTLKRDPNTRSPIANAGIKDVKILVKNGNEPAKEIKPPEELSVTSQRNDSWTAVWKVPEKPGEAYELTALVTDALGHRSPPQKAMINVKGTAASTGPGPKPLAKGTIRVIASYKGEHLKAPTLEEAPDRKPVPSKDQKYWDFTGLDMDQMFTVMVEHIGGGDVVVLVTDPKVKPSSAESPQAITLMPKKKKPAKDP